MRRIFKKVNLKLLVALIIAICTLGYLYIQLVPQENEKIKYTKYVIAKELIPIDTKITEEMLDYEEFLEDKIPQGVFKRKEDIINKFAETDILAKEIIREEKVKLEIASEYKEDEREVRIYTDVQAYGGVGAGNRADLIYVGSIGADISVGWLKYEGVLVKKVINQSGNSIEDIIEDKFNQVDNKPFLVVLTVNQKMAHEIETLQGLEQNVKFKLIRWTERSEKQGTEGTILTPETIRALK